jgi:hypothetical protein
MEYETWKIRGVPTPSEFLEVCDKCQKAWWTTATKGIVRYCEKHQTRTREGTRAEYAEAREALRKVIG